jgi:ubiquinone/menaquinone biosynthesis C-methylase UbiE
LERTTGRGDKAVIRSYFNNKAEIWDENFEERDSTKLNGMLRQINIGAGSRVLDVGTGTGILIPYLIDKIGDKGRLVCLDSAEKMLEKARQKNFKGHIDYVCGDINSSGLVDESFDAVVCYSSFPHFHDKSRALKEIHRLLRNGHSLYICHTSSRSSINKIHRQVPELAGDLIPPKTKMLHLLLSSGFEKIEIREETGSYFAKADKGSAADISNSTQL